ncbi:MAG: thioredoxin-like domain-containing protein [Bacteroidota bacterium]
MNLPSVNAPEINTEFGWLNTDRKYSIKDLRGKLVILDFWTFGCINCRHIIPDLNRLEAEFPDQLVVIGVHSAKFDSEKKTENINKAIQKFGIKHPVVNDAGFKIWDAYGVRAWPTVVLISPDGKVIGQHAGEGVYKVVKPALDSLVTKYADVLKKEPIPGFNHAEAAATQTEAGHADATALKFPSKMIADKEGNIWFSDSGHNRILKISSEGKLLETIGSGTEGKTDGSFASASFDEPHGLALVGNKLYIADTRNHLIRSADLQARTVSTTAGSGKMGYYYDENMRNVPVDPNSPWDLLPDGNNLYIANAGNHQVLRMDLSTEKVYRFAGSGREALTDGDIEESAFNQPSGLSLAGRTLYVADPEASAIRAIDLDKQTVSTIAGSGLFDFGDKDGPVKTALLQHCVGLEAHNNLIYIADTYNGKIKILDPVKKTISTFIPGLSEPDDLLFTGSSLWVSDTNNNRLLKGSPDGKNMKEVKITK